MFIPGGNRLLSSSFQRQLLSCRAAASHAGSGAPWGGGRRAGPGKCLQASAPGKAPADRRRPPVTYLPGQLEPRAGRGRDSHLPEVSFPQKETPSHQFLLFSLPPGLLSPSSYCPPHHRLVKRDQVVGKGGRAYLESQLAERTDSCPKEPPCLLESGFFLSGWEQSRARPVFHQSHFLSMVSIF